MREETRQWGSKSPHRNHSVVSPLPDHPINTNTLHLGNDGCIWLNNVNSICLKSHIEKKISVQGLCVQCSDLSIKPHWRLWFGQYVWHRAGFSCEWGHRRHGWMRAGGQEFLLFPPMRMHTPHTHTHRAFGRAPPSVISAYNKRDYSWIRLKQVWTSQYFSDISFLGNCWWWGMSKND